MIGKKCGVVLLVLGITFIIVGVVIEVVPEQMMPSILKQKLPLVRGSDTFETFSNPGKLPVTMQFRFFDIKNHVDANGTDGEKMPLEWGGKPIVEERGPYVYRETRERTVHEFNGDMTELTFSEKTYFQFDAEASNGTEDDIIHNINMPLLTVFGSLSQVPAMLQPTAKGMFNVAVKSENYKQTVVESKSVKEWLWGANSTLLDFVLTLPDSVLPPGTKEKIPSTKFGFMMDNNATSTYVIGTGYEDLKDVAQIKKYNNKTELDYWGSCYSNAIKGTDGTIFHPNIDPKETLFMFVGDLCRSIYATKTAETDVKGIKTYLFEPPNDVFADAADNPDNEGFCEPKPCLGSGLLRVSNCRHDAPLVITQPHLCGAAKSVQETIEGLNPDPKIHQTQLYVEPNLGVIVEAHKRLQFNALLLPEDGMELTVNLTKDQVVPLFWVQEGFTADEEFAAVVQSGVSAITFFPNNGKAIFYAAIATGIIMIVIAFFAVGNHKNNDDFKMSLVPPVRMSSIAKHSEPNFHENNGYRKQY